MARSALFLAVSLAAALYHTCEAQLPAQLPVQQQPAQLPNYLPTAKVAAKKALGKKVVRKALPPVSVKCVAFNQNPPFRVINCKFVSRLAVPVCAKFNCFPPPGGACPGMGGTGAVSNKACSWAITPNCSLPTPVYPTRGNEYGFGWMTTEPGPVQVTIDSFERVGFKGIQCPGAQVEMMT